MAVRESERKRAYQSDMLGKMEGESKLKYSPPIL